MFPNKQQLISQEQIRAQQERLRLEEAARQYTEKKKKWLAFLESHLRDFLEYELPRSAGLSVTYRQDDWSKDEHDPSLVLFEKAKEIFGSQCPQPATGNEIRNYLQELSQELWAQGWSISECSANYEGDNYYEFKIKIVVQ